MNKQFYQHFIDSGMDVELKPVSSKQWFVGNVIAIKVTGAADGWEY